ncbi:DUF6153 family protein [Streptomyces sp. NPDC049915]|uniref:DUF6153 family protein n=1 Tax=Streptomyces sp. NPDC049915 TaxID=3155510 RepID=UPI003424ECFE
MSRFEVGLSVVPRVRWWRVVAVLGLLAGLLGMHALAPGGVVPERHGHMSAPAVAGVVAGDGCAGSDGHCGGGHVHHADVTCASAAVSGGPELPAPVAAPGPVVVLPGTGCAYVGAAPDGARAPPSLAELQLLRI